jgi:hypothetical protein
MYSLYHFCTRKYDNPVLHVLNYRSYYLPQGHKASTWDMPQGHKSRHIRFAPGLCPIGITQVLALCPWGTKHVFL